MYFILCTQHISTRTWGRPALSLSTTSPPAALPEEADRRHRVRVPPRPTPAGQPHPGAPARRAPCCPGLRGAGEQRRGKPVPPTQAGVGRPLARGPGTPRAPPAWMRPCAMASAMRPAPTKPKRLGPDSAATAAAISPPPRAAPRPRPQRRQWATPPSTCPRPLAAETSRSAPSRGLHARSIATNWDHPFAAHWPERSRARRGGPRRGAPGGRPECCTGSSWSLPVDLGVEDRVAWSGLVVSSSPSRSGSG